MVGSYLRATPFTLTLSLHALSSVNYVVKHTAVSVLFFSTVVKALPLPLDIFLQVRRALWNSMETPTLKLISADGHHKARARSCSSLSRRPPPACRVQRLPVCRWLFFYSISPSFLSVSRSNIKRLRNIVFLLYAR